MLEIITHSGLFCKCVLCMLLARASAQFNSIVVGFCFSSFAIIIRALRAYDECKIFECAFRDSKCEVREKEMGAKVKE